MSGIRDPRRDEASLTWAMQPMMDRIFPTGHSSLCFARGVMCVE